MTTPTESDQHKAEAMLPLDTYVHPWGKIAAIRWDGRERFYLFVDNDGSVALMPASTVLAQLAASGEGGS